MNNWTQADVAKANKARGKAPPFNDQPERPILNATTEPEPVEAPVVRRFIWKAAEGIHLKQFPERFRIVIEGPLDEQPAVEAALQVLQTPNP